MIEENYLTISYIVIPAIIILKGIQTHNSFIIKNNAAEESLSGIKVQLKKKIDLIPNLIKTVKSYASHEKEVLINLTEIREHSKDLVENNSNELNRINKTLSETLSKLSIRVESYPDLKASEQYIKFQEELSSIEEEIAASRRIYNSAANKYNNCIQIFPNNILASIEKKEKKELFAENKENLETESEIKVDFE